jgi:hypothetical protein
MATKEEALDQITALIKAHDISLNEIKARAPLKTSSNSAAIKKIFGFIGAIFILCGLSIYTQQYWSVMNPAARTVITLGSGIALFVLAIVATFDDRYKKTVTPLFLLAALFQAGGLFVAITELFNILPSIRVTVLIIASVMCLQQLIVFYKLQKTSLLFIALLFGFAAVLTCFDLLQVKIDHVGVIMGLALLCICYGLNYTKHRSITPFWYFIGSLMFLCGLFEVMQYSIFEVGYLGVTAFMIYLSVLVRSRMLLFTSTLAMITYIGYFTVKHFIHSTGWPLALVVFGFILLAISAAAVKVNRMIKM